MAGNRLNGVQGLLAGGSILLVRELLVQGLESPVKEFNALAAVSRVKFVVLQENRPPPETSKSHRRKNAVGSQKFPRWAAFQQRARAVMNAELGALPLGLATQRARRMGAQENLIRSCGPKSAASATQKIGAAWRGAKWGVFFFPSFAGFCSKPAVWGRFVYAESKGLGKIVLT